MVDVSGAKPIGDRGASRLAATTPVVPVATVAPSSTPSTGPDTAQTSGLAASMAASAPVDTDRVATIKKAIAEGRFPIVPAKIADRLIALRLQWNPNGAGNDEA